MNRRGIGGQWDKGLTGSGERGDRACWRVATGCVAC